MLCVMLPYPLVQYNVLAYGFMASVYILLLHVYIDSCTNLILSFQLLFFYMCVLCPICITCACVVRPNLVWFTGSLLNLPSNIVLQFIWDYLSCYS